MDMVNEAMGVSQTGESSNSNSRTPKRRKTAGAWKKNVREEEERLAKEEEMERLAKMPVVVQSAPAPAPVPVEATKPVVTDEAVEEIEDENEDDEDDDMDWEDVDLTKTSECHLFNFPSSMLMCKQWPRRLRLHLEATLTLCSMTLRV
jgi:hypothetical protein